MPVVNIVGQKAKRTMFTVNHAVLNYHERRVNEETLTTPPHTHEWKRSTRRHGRPGRFFIECACGAKSQASIQGGYMHVFNTGRDRGGKTIAVSFRLDAERFKKLRAHKINVRKVIENFIDNLP